MIECTNMKFFRASVVKHLSAGSDMIKVRILPDMLGAADEDLPTYAMFDGSSVIRGTSEEDTNDPYLATQVWVIATSDYKLGYVFCLANEEYSIDTDEVNEPYGYYGLLKQVASLGLDTNSFDYKELSVLYSNNKLFTLYSKSNDKKSVSPGVSLDVVNSRTGERAYFISSGTTLALMQGEILARVGAPKEYDSHIKITSNLIQIVSNNIEIYGREHTSLGKHGLKVVGITGAPSAVDGSPIIGFDDLVM